MNFYFPKHVLHPFILRGADGEVAESMRKNPRIDMDSATPCIMTSRGGDRMEEETSSVEVSAKNQVKNDMIGTHMFCMILIEQFQVNLLLSFTTHLPQIPDRFIRYS